jgi:hypothetical protein
MIMAKCPDSEFVHDVLVGIIQRVTVRILPPRLGVGFGSGGSCGDSGNLPATPRWPTIYTYGLREYKGASRGEDSQSIPVAELGERKVVAYRFEENLGWGSCWRNESDAAFLHELVAYWLGMKASSMPWKPEETLDIVWTTRKDYEQEIGAFVEADRAKMSATVFKLKEKKLLDKLEIDGTFPQISMQFECYIHPCPLPNCAELP